MSERLTTTQDARQRRLRVNRFTRLGPQTPQDIQPDMDLANRVVHTSLGHDPTPGEYPAQVLKKDLIYHVGSENLFELAELIPQIVDFPSEK